METNQVSISCWMDKEKINIHTKSWPWTTWEWEQIDPHPTGHSWKSMYTLTAGLPHLQLHVPDPTKHESCGTVANTYWKIYTYQETNEFKPHCSSVYCIYITISAALEWYIHIHTMEYYSSMRGSKILYLLPLNGSRAHYAEEIRQTR